MLVKSLKDSSFTTENNEKMKEFIIPISTAFEILAQSYILEDLNDFQSRSVLIENEQLHFRKIKYKDGKKDIFVFKVDIAVYKLWCIQWLMKQPFVKETDVNRSILDVNYFAYKTLYSLVLWNNEKSGWNDTITMKNECIFNLILEYLNFQVDGIIE